MKEKRFVIKRDGFCAYCVSDRLNQYPMPITDSISCEFIANALNELNDENTRLKQKIDLLKMEIAELRESEKDNYNITDGLW